MARPRLAGAISRATSGGGHPLARAAGAAILSVLTTLRLTVLVGALLASAACSEPPQKEIDRAQGALDAARAAGAERYAPTDFTAAASALQQAHEAVAQRDYRLALAKAVDASERAQQAAREAADGKARVRAEAERTIATTATALQQLRTVIGSEGARAGAPALTAARHAAASAQAALQKARAHLAMEQYLESRDAVKGTADRIGEQIRAVNEAARSRPGRRRT
jgi:hypothetical protein